MNRWLLGTGRGIYQSNDGWGWTRLSEYDYRITAMVPDGDQIVAACGSGLWQIVPDNPVWIQLHDETLTEVMDVAQLPDKRLVAASAYGVATGHVTDDGVMRWRWHSDHLSVNARFTNAICVVSETNWLIGTEAGVLVTEDAGKTWDWTGLTGIGIRSLRHYATGWWAATDQGVWVSDDGLIWQHAGKGLEDRAVFEVATNGDEIVLGTEDGVWCGSEEGEWKKAGLHGQVHTIGVHPTTAGLWVAGCVPGGVWVTDTAGQRWSHMPDLPDAAEAVVSPA